MPAPSRYAMLPKSILPARQSATPVQYRSARLLDSFTPAGEAGDGARLYTVMQGDRLDLVAYKTLGDPTLYWMIADENVCMNPFDLLTVGAQLKLPPIVPGAGRVPAVGSDQRPPPTDDDEEEE